jgi:5-methylcytosine-specific restriction endonuclease McrA
MRRHVECQRAEWRRKNNLRPGHEKAIYGSSAWQQLARSVVAGATQCYWCHATDVQLTADHITTVRAAPRLALEPSNVVAACRSCQERRKQRRYPLGGGGAA